jgi:sulfur dioxygenase
MTSLTFQSKNLVFRQLFDQESSTFTYLLADAATKEAILIDPVLEQTERDLSFIKELGLNLKYAINSILDLDSDLLSSSLPR